MAYLNEARLILKVTSDPQINTSANDKKTARFLGKTYQSWIEDGMTKTIEETHNIVVFSEKIIENVIQDLSQGDYVYIEGLLQRSSWTDASGNKKFTYEVSVTQFDSKCFKLGTNLDNNSTLNSFTCIGNLGKDAEVRQTRNGKSVVSLVVATGQKWRNSAGEMQEKTDWHNVSIFNDHLVNITRELQKGDRICVQGAMKKKDSEDKVTGVIHQNLNIVMSRILTLQRKNYNRDSSESNSNFNNKQEEDSFDNISF